MRRSRPRRRRTADEQASNASARLEGGEGGDIEVMGLFPTEIFESALKQIRSFRELFAGLLPNLKVTSANPMRFAFPNSSPCAALLLATFLAVEKR